MLGGTIKMSGRRTKDHFVGMSRLYVYNGKRTQTFYTITPENKRKNLGHDLFEAKKKLLELMGPSIQSLETTTVSARLDELMKARQKLVNDNKLSAASYKTNELEVENLKKAFGKMQVTAVLPEHIWSYLHEFRGVQAPIRANREIALLSSMFKRAHGKGLVKSNPCEGVERNKEIPRDRLVTDKELRDFFKFAWNKSDSGKRAALALAIAYLTGKAQAQILKLTTDQFLDDGIYFGKRKRGAATHVRWSRLLRKLVNTALAMPSRVKPKNVIHTQDGSAYTTDGFKTIWQRLQSEWVKMGNERFTFHDIRAKTVTDVTEKGERASNLTGHRTEAVVSKVYDRRRVRKAKAVR